MYFVILRGCGGAIRKMSNKDKKVRAFAQSVPGWADLFGLPKFKKPAAFVSLLELLKHFAFRSVSLAFV